MVSLIKIDGRMFEGIFQERLNRFLVLAKVDEEILPSFLSNPGRMHELLIPGTKVVLREASNGSRKTNYDMIGDY